MDSHEAHLKLNDRNASTTPANPDASTTPANPDASTTSANPDASTTPANPDATTPANPYGGTPVNSDARTAVSAMPANPASTPNPDTFGPASYPLARATTVSPPPEYSWSDADIGVESTRAKISLVRETNLTMLAILILLAIAGVVTGNVDRAWNLLYMWIGGLTGWLLRDRKDPKPDD